MALKQTILAFDFGLRKIGVAVGNTETKTTLPLKIIFADSEKVLWDSIGQVIVEWKPNLLIVGDPINMDGTASEMCGKARRFAERLHKRFSLKVHMVDERLTTAEARIDFSSKTDAKRIDQHLDSLAAEIILKDWMMTN